MITDSPNGLRVAAVWFVVQRSHFHLSQLFTLTEMYIYKLYIKYILKIYLWKNISPTKWIHYKQFIDLFVITKKYKSEQYNTM